jgi:hypothetical protein
MHKQTVIYGRSEFHPSRIFPIADESSAAYSEPEHFSQHRSLGAGEGKRRREGQPCLWGSAGRAAALDLSRLGLTCGRCYGE